MPFKDQEEAYNWCTAEGNFKIQEEVNLDRVKSNLLIVAECLETAQDAVVKERWNSVYILYYDVLHLLVESLLVFDKVKSLNHQCLFTYLCVEHPLLELDWGFFEKVRTKRNGINYYGSLVDQKDWKEVELQTNLYIKLLREEIEKKLK